MRKDLRIYRFTGRIIINIVLIRYNILNECPDFPSPTKSPLLYYFKSGKGHPLNFLEDRISPDDEEKLIKYINCGPRRELSQEHPHIRYFVNEY